MSWVKTDDALHDSAKIAVLSDAAFRLWSMALCWSNRAENEGTEGFIPEALLGTKISEGRWPRTRLKKLTEELVNCGNVIGKSGLWEPVAGGWKVHDWHEYRPQPQKLSREEAARLAGQRSAEVRRQRNGTAQPRPAERNSNVRETFGSSLDEQCSGDVQSNETRTSRTPVPVPVPGDKYPPTPQDSFADSFRGRLPTQRDDVKRLFELWRTTFGFNGAKLVSRDSRATILADAIDDHGLSTCERVLAHAKNDGMVSGRDDEKRVKHEKINYIFGNQDTFARILRAADEADSKKSGSIGSIMSLAKSREVSQ